MAKNSRNFEKSDQDKLKDTNEKLKAQVRKLTKENSKLKSEIRTLESAWGKTSNYLRDITEDKSLSSLIKDAEYDRPFKKDDECPMCHTTVKPIVMPTFVFFSCAKCGFRKKTPNEIQSDQGNEDN